MWLSDLLGKSWWKGKENIKNKVRRSFLWKDKEADLFDELEESL